MAQVVGVASDNVIALNSCAIIAIHYTHTSHIIHTSHRGVSNRMGIPYKFLRGIRGQSPLIHPRLTTDPLIFVTGIWESLQESGNLYRNLGIPYTFQHCCWPLASHIIHTYLILYTHITHYTHTLYTHITHYTHIYIYLI